MGERAGARWSRREWAIRGLLALMVLVAGYLGVCQTLAASLRASHPERAHRLAPYDGRASALLGRKLLSTATTPSERLKARRMAQAALRQDPTSVAAAATLGLVAQVNGDSAAARTIFAYAERLSRRDIQTQLWAIEDAVSRDDVAGALRHYDIALRTTRRATDLLYPVLGTAISDPVVRTALVRTLARKPAWQDSFISYVSVNGPIPRATALLFQMLHQRGHQLSDEATAAVTTKLIRDGAFEDAWRYYASVRQGADRRSSRDPAFRAMFAEATPFDWMPINDNGVSASMQRGERGGVFEFAAPSSVGGTVLRQQQLLPSGSYSLAGHSSDIDQPENSRPYWALSCSDGRELGRVTLPPSSQKRGAFSGILAVPRDCPVQMLELIVRPSDAVSGVSGRIERVELRPVARSSKQAGQ
ncbi:tetratricopeptide repeat protein [Sphingomonas dokdonensis]|uniref:Tetratricopeptide repeat protein n=1 Tax=Sphingomonas dokdonensis TaxID=344880 RepID=A0A2D0A4L9_9SPHN|nr:hypothetical protein [Sphingomonas dokdonensis]OWK27843.1 hypothetical protein SPDO_30830 [Sphingomonas dokdonensis]